MALNIGGVSYDINASLLECDLFAYLKEIGNNNIEIDVSHLDVFMMIYKNDLSQISSIIEESISSFEYDIKKDGRKIEIIEKWYKSFLYFGNNRIINEIHQMVYEVIVKEHKEIFKYIYVDNDVCGMKGCFDFLSSLYDYDFASGKYKVVDENNNDLFRAVCSKCGNTINFMKWVSCRMDDIISIFSFDKQWKKLIPS